MVPQQCFQLRDCVRTTLPLPARGDILVIENDAAIGDFIAELLRDEGYTVRSTANVERAQAALAVHQPDLIFCDLHLQGTSGIDFIRNVQQRGATNMPIVATTTGVPATRALDLDGIALCLPKPFDIDDLLNCVASHIRPRAEQSRRYRLPLPELSASLV
jgi:DNA-binding response OmpR family regulator